MLGAIVLPRTKHGIAGHHQLFVRVLRKVALGVLLDGLLVLRDHLLQRLGVEVGVEPGFFLLLFAVENFVEYRFLNIEHNIAEHLNQAAIRVIGKTRIIAALGERFHTLVVQAKVEDRIHHAGH